MTAQNSTNDRNFNYEKAYIKLHLFHCLFALLDVVGLIIININNKL